MDAATRVRTPRLSIKVSSEDHGDGSLIFSPKMRIEKRKSVAASVSSFVWFCLFYNA